MNNLQKDILNKIKAGEIDMKPKWHFVLKTGLFFSGIVMVALLCVYFLSFVIFFLHQSGIGFAPGFGFRGISFFVVSSPWLLIATSAAFLILLYFLVKQYSFSYQRPLLYSMLGIILVALLGSLALQQTPMHQRLSELADRHEVPLFSPLYRGAVHERPEGVVVGTVTSLTEDGFFMESEQEGVIEVVVTTETRMRRGVLPAVDEQVMVFGDREGETVTAFGVRPADRVRDGEQMGRPKKLQRLDGSEGPRGPGGQEGQLMRPMKDRPQHYIQTSNER